MNGGPVRQAIEDLPDRSPGGDATNTVTPRTYDDCQEQPAMSDTGDHLHLDDYPTTLALLAALLQPKLHDRDGLAEIGYNPTEHGAWVDWGRLASSWLSSTEVAVVHIARGIAVLENHGGPPPRLNKPLREALAAVTEPPPRPAWFDQLDDEPEGFAPSADEP